MVVAIRLVLDPVATHFTRKALNDADGIRGDFHSVHVTVFPPGYQIRRLKIVEHPGDDWKHPLFYAERVTARRSTCASCFTRRVAARARLDEPKVVFSKQRQEETTLRVPDVRDALARRDAGAHQPRRGARRRGRVSRSDRAPRSEDLGPRRSSWRSRTWPRGRSWRAAGRPPASGSAKLGRSGDVTLFVSANPFAPKLEFAGEIGRQGLEGRGAVRPDRAGDRSADAARGRWTCSPSSRRRTGAITGGVKPVLKNVKVRPTEDDFGNKLKAWLADKGLRLFSDRVPDRNAVVTIVPIKGRLDDPDIQLWPTVLGVIRNAFVEGISSGFTHLPPPTADKPQGKVEQLQEGTEEGRGAAGGAARAKQDARSRGEEDMKRGVADPGGRVRARRRLRPHEDDRRRHRQAKGEGRTRSSRREEAKPRPSVAEAAQRARIPGNPDAVPVATAPEALLAPGAEDKIRERLVAGGFLAGDAKSDAAMREGFRRFQRAQDLPATGVAGRTRR